MRKLLGVLSAIVVLMIASVRGMGMAQAQVPTPGSVVYLPMVSRGQVPSQLDGMVVAIDPSSKGPAPLVLVDPKTGTVNQMPFAIPETLWWAGMSQVNGKLAYGGWAESPDGDFYKSRGLVHLVDLSNGQVTWTKDLGIPAQARVVELSPLGDFLAYSYSWYWEGVEVVDLRSGRQLTFLDRGLIGWLSSELLVLTSYSQGAGQQFYVIDVVSNRELGTIKGIPDSRFLRISPDGKHVSWSDLGCTGSTGDRFYDRVMVGDFDASTLQVTNPRELGRGFLDSWVGNDFVVLETGIVCSGTLDEGIVATSLDGSNRHVLGGESGLAITRCNAVDCAVWSYWEDPLPDNNHMHIRVIDPRTGWYRSIYYNLMPVFYGGFGQSTLQGQDGLQGLLDRGQAYEEVLSTLGIEK